MNKQEAVILSQNTFSGGFDEKQFTTFISNLFKDYEPLAANVAGGQLKEAFKPFVSHYKRIGKYTDAEGNVIDTIIVHLKKGSSLERARTAQRNFVAEYLKTRDKDAALVAFLSPDSSDWRLSLVKFETTFQHDEAKGKLKMVSETTPAKRWSFLIGENEGKHTVTSRFLDLLQSDVSPNLAELEAAFDVETVSEEFYEKYKELFLRMKDALDELVKRDADIRADFEAKEISTVDFAKKTMGQMAFLYFLQKKGWFGVAPKAAWGTGQKNFLRDLFNRRDELQVSHSLGVNFFDDIMEPLFYDALASDRRDSDDFYNRLNCRMPFLNGGLFEPIQGYAWTTTHIRFPDELFSNKNKTKEGDIGDGILDIFDRYNFTVNESEPLEKEVAVDPEMLGKVFENLLEIKDRKSKGAYYTPREIVHYMCQQCLINHLETELFEQSSIAREDIEFLIQNGSRIIENDQMVIDKGKETEAYTFMLPVSIRSEANRVDDLLASIKVCDPAVGSGAFPLGMLNEIIRARAALAVHQHKKIDYFELKKHTIINSLYGVDLDGGAVEIAKLRLWLALVVEENEPHPLPNLECKIMQGNSLISQYEGITLFDETILEDIKSIETEKAEVTQRINTLQSHYFEVHGSEREQALKQEELKKIEKAVKGLKKRQKALSDPSSLSSEEMSLFAPPQERKIAHEKSLELQRLIKEFIDTSQNKKTLKAKIDNLKWELIEATLKEQGKAAKLDEIKALRKRHEKPFFIWKLEFSDVFRDKGGFDIVIGNPPYVGESGNKDTFRPIASGNLGRYYLGKMDLFYFFFHLSLDLAKDRANCSFITTNYFLTASGAKKLREDLHSRASIRELINFNEYRIFASALGQHNIITVFDKGASSRKTHTTLVSKTGVASSYDLSSVLRKTDKECAFSEIESEHLYDGEEKYIRLEGTQSTGNPINQILDKVATSGIPLSSLFQVNQGIVSGCDYVSGRNIKKLKGENEVQLKDGIFVFDLKNPRDLQVLQSFSEEEKHLLRPFYKNSDIARYWSSSACTKNILYYPDNLNGSDYPNICKHLEKFKDILEARLHTYNETYHWTALHRSREENIFVSKKIIVPYRARKNAFSINRDEWFCRSDCYVITSKSDELDLRYVLSLLNSKLYYLWLYFRGKRKGEVLELFNQPLSEIPIKKSDKDAQAEHIALVDKIYAITSSEDYNPSNPPKEQLSLEAQIDELVFDLYELTDDERQLVRDTVE